MDRTDLRNADGNANTCSDTDGVGLVAGDGHTNANIDGNFYADEYGDTDTYANGDGNAYADGDTIKSNDVTNNDHDLYSNAHQYCNPDGITDGDTAA